MILAPNTRLLFIGDSITDCGRRQPIGDGKPDALGNGYVSLIDAALAARFPHIQFRVTNMGISGNTARNLLDRFQTDALDLHPHTLTIKVGINDAWRQLGRPLHTEQHVPPDDYRTLLAQLLSRATPHVSNLIVMSPFFLEPNRHDPLRALVDQYVTIAGETARAHNALFINTQSAFDQILTHRHSIQLSSDRIHPYLIGHQILADAWLTAVAALPAPSSP